MYTYYVISLEINWRYNIFSISNNIILFCCYEDIRLGVYSYVRLQILNQFIFHDELFVEL